MIKFVMRVFVIGYIIEGLVNMVAIIYVFEKKRVGLVKGLFYV